MNKTERLRHAKRIAHYCEVSDRELMEQMTFYTLNDAGKYLGWLQRPGSKILAVAHIDYHCSGRVHKASPETVVSSALDDRLGVYMAMEALPEIGVRCDVLLTDDEESAMSTMQGLGMAFLRRYNWIIQLDYPGEGVSMHGYTGMRDAVQEVFGPAPPVSFTDISFVKDYSPISAFNAPTGYVQQHTEGCHVSMPVFARCLERIKAFYDVHKDTKFVENEDVILTEPMHDARFSLFSTPKEQTNVVPFKYEPGEPVGRWEEYVDSRWPLRDAPGDENYEWDELCTMCGHYYDAMSMETYDGHYVCPGCNDAITGDYADTEEELDDDEPDGNTKPARRKRAKKRANPGNSK